MNKELNIFQAALRLAPYFLGYKPQQTQTQEQKPTLTEKDIALINLRRKDGAVIVVLGTIDTGKTELCYRLAEFLDKPTYAVSPQQKPPSWIEWIKLDEIFEKVKPDSTLICDDLPAYASNRDYNEALVKQLERITPMVRHDPQPPEFPTGRLHLIFASQSSAQSDKHMTTGVEAAFFKPLGLLFEDLERPNIKKIYTEYVNPIFDGKSLDWVRRHAYMWSREFRGLIKVEKTTRQDY